MQTVSETNGTILVSAGLPPALTRSPTGASTSFSFPFKGTAAPSADVIVIASLLPNPVGLDDDFEEVTLKNKGSAAVSLVGWKLRDRSGAIWTLDGTIAAGQSKTIRRNRMAMTLNNAGDDIALVDPTGAVHDTFNKTTSQEESLFRPSTKGVRSHEELRMPGAAARRAARPRPVAASFARSDQPAPGAILSFSTLLVNNTVSHVVHHCRLQPTEQ